MITPLDQFKIYKIYDISTYPNYLDLNINNSTLYLFISILLTYIIISLPAIKYLIYYLYTYLENMLNGLHSKYLPLSLSLFFFLLFNNLLGLIPYSFTLTAQLIITLTMSLTIIIGVTIIGIMKHKGKFINLFIPAGLDSMKYLIPFIFSIEIISYLIRIISLSVRLTANMVSGHTLLKIISHFTFQGILKLVNLSFLFKILAIPFILVIPIIFISGIYILEIGVAIIQSYVFTLLTLLYIKDSELLH